MMRLRPIATRFYFTLAMIGVANVFVALLFQSMFVSVLLLLFSLSLLIFARNTVIYIDEQYVSTVNIFYEFFLKQCARKMRIMDIKEVRLHIGHYRFTTWKEIYIVDAKNRKLVVDMSFYRTGILHQFLISLASKNPDIHFDPATEEIRTLGTASMARNTQQESNVFKIIIFLVLLLLGAIYYFLKHTFFAA